MTVSVVGSPTLVPRPQIDEWLHGCRKNTDPNCRPDEWSHETWLFTGDPDNDRTVLFRCTTKKCQSLKTPRACAHRAAGHAAIGHPLDEFLATYNPDGGRHPQGGVLPRCSVRNGENRCCAPSHCLGLCQRHYAQWKTYRTSGNLVLDEWSVTIPTPMPPSTERCIVLGCKQAPFCKKKLCLYHENKFKRASPGIPAAEWARTQTPFLQAEHFSLWPLKEVLRWGDALCPATAGPPRKKYRSHGGSGPGTRTCSRAAPPRRRSRPARRNGELAASAVYQGALQRGVPTSPNAG